MMSNIISYGNTTLSLAHLGRFKLTLLSNPHLEAVILHPFIKTIFLFLEVLPASLIKEMISLFLTLKKTPGTSIGSTNNLSSMKTPPQHKLKSSQNHSKNHDQILSLKSSHAPLLLQTKNPQKHKNYQILTQIHPHAKNTETQ